MLLRISRILKHNFFKYYVPEQDTGSDVERISHTENPPDEQRLSGQSELENRVIHLENEVTYLKEIYKLQREMMDNLKS